MYKIRFVPPKFPMWSSRGNIGGIKKNCTILGMKRAFPQSKLLYCLIKQLNDIVLHHGWPENGKYYKLSVAERIFATEIVYFTFLSQPPGRSRLSPVNKKLLCFEEKMASFLRIYSRYLRDPILLIFVYKSPPFPQCSHTPPDQWSWRNMVLTNAACLNLTRMACMSIEGLSEISTLDRSCVLSYHGFQKALILWGTLEGELISWNANQQRNGQPELALTGQASRLDDWKMFSQSLTGDPMWHSNSNTRMRDWW